MYTAASSNTILDYNLVRFGVCMIKLRHERILILRLISFRQKTELPPEKKLQGHHLKILNTLTRNSSHWKYLNLMRNLKLLENISLHPPTIKEKENLSLQENEKTSLLVKVSTTLKLPPPL